VSFGYLTGPAFAYAAVRLRSWRLGAAATVYLAIAVVICAWSQGPNASPPDAALTIGFGVNMLLGTVHAAFVQRRLFRTAPAAPTDPAMAAAIARRQRRQQARQLLTDDPALAAELCIGRPDLPRQFDDGGLIDVNRVPVPVLAWLPGVGPDHAQQIADARERGSGLSCVEDLIVYADMPAEAAESLRDLLVFRPLSA
jgi:DNA uptake protein ComE-like DNA-binding protein